MHGSFILVLWLIGAAPQDGVAEFTAGDEKIVVPAGNVVVVPAETVHGFKSVADDKLRVVSVHPSPTVQQTDL